MPLRLAAAALTACALAVLVVPAGAAPTASSAARHCKSGYKRVKVRRHHRTRYVCRRKKKRPAATPAPVAPTPSPTPVAPAAPAGPAGPSVAEVEAAIRGGAQAQHEPWLGPESVEVVFEQPTQVLGVVQYDPYAADPNHAGGPIDAWPVRAWTKIVNHHDDTPADDTTYAGCDGHLDHAWPHDMIYMFYVSDAGGWTFKTTPVSAGKWDCG